jgi:uncharacterized protein Veg
MQTMFILQFQSHKRFSLQITIGLISKYKPKSKLKEYYPIIFVIMQISDQPVSTKRTNRYSSYKTMPFSIGQNEN